MLVVLFTTGGMQKKIRRREQQFTWQQTCKKSSCYHQCLVPNLVYSPTDSWQRKMKHVKQVMSIRWHEDISGRSAADVTSAFRKAISMMAEDAKHIVIWCDNCPAQNKNRTYQIHEQQRSCQISRYTMYMYCY